MNYRSIVFAAAALALTACSQPPPPSAQDAKAAFLRACERRLQNRTNLSARQIASFCPCFASAASAKHDMNRLNAEMESGSDDIFKSTLQAEFDQCKRTM
ncbi:MULTISPECIES: hypothetical protein [unclassified Lysobacter]|uniref:hypothetical protein n=1 Tax=unclassified Lysobacter TaxID=2635362 RepID=UPI001BE7B99E|nr:MULTISPECIES: hypothetical protein [unclassified Lysobacter]MBT2750137.1 hypothetical protein [Lysobacter sp. ISL-50]MBT2775291.1 hypothetical protein [Lysobacter sp. ISL-54]MBT2782665.1 hypothetical protein [Lysobacter sp. ISL-52]